MEEHKHIFIYQDVEFADGYRDIPINLRCDCGMEPLKRIAALEAEIIALKAETRHGMYSKSRYDQCLSNLLSELERTGYQPNGLQMKYREKPAPDIDWQELEWAVCDALLHQGTIIAWPGDGVSCVAQMIAGQAERAETAEAERDRLRDKISDFYLSGFINETLYKSALRMDIPCKECGAIGVHEAGCSYFASLAAKGE